MGKISKKYIGADQVGSAQIELENNNALRAKSADGLSSQDILEIDPANLLQMLKHPYLPGDATAALQSIPKQQLDSAVSGLSGDIAALDDRLDILEPKVSTLESEMDAVQAELISLDGRLDILEPKVSTLESEMDAVQASIISLEAEDLTFVKLDGSRAMTGDLSMMPSLGVHHKITGLADPVDPRDAVNKQYVDAFAEGLHVHAPAKVIVNSSLESVTGGTVDYDNGASGVGATLTLSVPLTSYLGYTFQNNDRIIINGQTNQAHNGIYTVGANGTLGSVLTRALDFNSPAEIAGGDFVFVQNGTGIANTGWVETLTVTQVGVDPITFLQFSGAGVYTAGDGMTLIGTEFNVKYDNTTISLNGSNELRVDPAVMSRIDSLESNKAEKDLSNLVANPSGAYVLYSDITFSQSNDVIIRSKAFNTSEASNGMFIFTGSTQAADSGNLSIYTGNVLNGGSANSGVTTITTGEATGSGNSGGTFIRTGGSVSGFSGNITLTTGSAISGQRGAVILDGASAIINSPMYFSNSGWNEIKSFDSSSSTGGMGFKSGDSSSGDSGVVAIGSGDAPNGAAGNLVLFSGIGAAGRGFVQIEASKLNMLGFIDMNSSKIVNLQDPSAAQDAATKAYVDSQIAAGTDFHKQAITLSAGDITNQFVDISVQAIAQSCQIGVGERVMLWEGLDYSVSVVGGVSRISFIGPSASAGAEALVAGQTLYIQCVIE